MGNHTIHIDYNGTEITADPDSLVIKDNGPASIAWVLRNVPAGTKFASGDGIAFKANNPKHWPGTAPSGNDTRYSSDENVQESNAGKYNYEIKLIVNNVEKKKDPDVTNDPPGGVRPDTGQPGQPGGGQPGGGQPGGGQPGSGPQ